MELHHTLKLSIGSDTGLIALGMILVAVVVVVLTVALRRGRGQEGGLGGAEVALSVRAGHRLNDAQQGGVEPASRGPDRICNAGSEGHG